jgi:hypothetical protein
MISLDGLNLNSDRVSMDLNHSENPSQSGGEGDEEMISKGERRAAILIVMVMKRLG